MDNWRKQYARHNFHRIEEEWSKGWEYHLIPTGVALRKLLLERLGEDFLNRYCDYMIAKDVTLQTSYIIVCFSAGSFRFDLQNIGYTEMPRWELSGHDSIGKWERIKIADDRLREELENWFSLAESDKRWCFHPLEKESTMRRR